MTVDKNRRSLLRGATALGLSLGISPLLVTKASASAFIKFDGIDGEAHGDKKTWVSASIEGKRLMLKDKRGKVTQAIKGTYKLENGAVITVENGIIVKHLNDRTRR